MVSDTAIAVRNEKGEIVYFDGIVEDITDVKKAEKDLSIQKVYYEELIKSAPEAIVLHDSNDIVLHVNEEFVKMYGYTREEVESRPINDLIATGELREGADRLSAMVLNGEKVYEETKRKRKDGALIDVSILGAPIKYDGKLMGVFVIYRDITERKKAEDEILLQKTYFEELFNSASAKECMDRANKLFYQSTDARIFASLFYGILDTRNNNVNYANAGQNVPLVFSRNNEPIPLKTRDMALGIKEDVSYK